MLAIPDKCPFCETSVWVHKDPKSSIETLWCLNGDCPGKLKEDLAVIGSRDVLEIDLLGPELAMKLVDEGYVVALPDLFLFAQELQEKHSQDPEGYKSALSSQGFSPANMTKFYVSAIESLDSRDWDRWIVALNIEGIGKVLGKQLAMALNLQGMDTLCERLLTIGQAGLEGFGEVKIEAITQWAMDPRNKALCDELHEVGVKPKVQSVKKVETNSDGPCAGMVVCITGEHLGMEREEIQNHLARLGATIKTGVSKKLTHLIAGAGAGPSKVQKARDNGTVIFGTDWLKETFEKNGIKITGGGLEFDEDVEI